jgi:type VI protein secretion system component Hcp
MAFDIYLQLAGITGQTAVKGHETDIGVQSFSWDIANDPAGTALTAGDLHLVAPTGKHTPQLLRALADRTAIATGHLSHLTIGSTGLAVETLRLSLARITVTDLQLQVSTADGALDRLSLAIGEVTEEARIQQPSGALPGFTSSDLVVITPPA